MSEIERPDDFDLYWNAVDQDLVRYPAAPTLERLALPSDEFSNVYALRLTSIGPYRIFGYLSVPPGDGPFPGYWLRHTTAASTTCRTWTIASAM